MVDRLRATLRSLLSISDVRLALRQYSRQPAYALTVVCTLALATGATTAVFVVVHAVLVRSLPFAASERLVWVASVRPDNPRAPFSLPEFMDYRSRTRMLAGLAAYANWSASLTGDGVTERLQGARMSAHAFDVLGLRPAVGRLLTESDDRPDAPQVVVLSYRLWQRRYGGAPDIAGTTARINAQSFVIVGVLPPHFPLPLRGIDVVTPLVPDRDPLRHARNSVNFLNLFGRLAADVDAEQAQAELTAICRSLRDQFPVEYASKESVRLDAFQEVLVGAYRSSMVVLFAAVVVVLAAAIANVLSLALVRARERRADVSMRLALGASRFHLVRQFTTEALLLVVAGCGLAWLVAAEAVTIGVRWAPPAIPRMDEVRLDSAAAGFVAVAAAVVTLVLTLAPLGVAVRTGGGESLRAAGRAVMGDRWSVRVRNAVVVAEIATAVVLVLATIVLVDGLRRLHNLHPGFDPDGAFQARVSIPPTYRTPDDVSRFYERLFERLTASPGVTHVGIISAAPLSGLLRTVPFSVLGQAVDPRTRPSANLRAISPDYPLAVRTRLLQGRSFSDADRPDTTSVALVSAALADRVLATEALGRQLLIDDNNRGPRPVEIVGVVENVRQTALDLPPAFDVYLPLRQAHPDGIALLRNNQFWIARTDSDAARFRTTFLAHLRAVDPDAAVSDAGPMREFVDASLGPRRFTLGLFGAFAATSVLLAVSGLYGLVSYAVSQRQSELGLRLALGATRGDVQRLVLRQAVVLGIAGAAVGVGVALAVRPVISQTVQEVTLDSRILGASATLLLGVVLLAAWMPARRAARIEPAVALKAG